MRTLELGQLPAFRDVVGKLIVGKNGSGNDVGSHRKASKVEWAAAAQ
jgi:hypothetical protein